MSFPRELLPVRLAQVAVDLVLMTAAFVGAYLIRFEGVLPEWAWTQMVVLAPYVVLARFLVNLGFGIYRIVWRYIGMREAVRFSQAVGCVSVLLLLLRAAWPGQGTIVHVPYGIIVVEGLLTFTFLCGVRFFRRLHYERRERSARMERLGRPLVPTLLIGAGEGGLVLAKEIARSADLGMRVVGFLDDDPKKHRMDLHGSRVLGRSDDLAFYLEETGAERVLITSPRLSAALVLKVVEFCRETGVEVRTVPPLYEVLGSKLEVGMLREVRIEDLLARDPVPPSLPQDDLAKLYGGRTVLVTGAGGSIGSEMTRQIVRLGVGRLLLAERDENNLFEIERELRSKLDARTELVPLLIDVADTESTTQMFREHRPEVVFHAAAYKHVPVMEQFPCDALRNNVFATQQLAELASENGCENFVMISTDKAVNPTSVMGATKRVAEMVVQRAARGSATRFSCVRFGNVLGSRGSVVGIFREQIQRGGPITVTHEEMTRYFMTIPEAANLVLQAATLGDIGEVFLLDMGEPVKIIDLARQMIKLSNLTETDIPIRIVGLRPGEKLFEELSMSAEDVTTTELRKISRVKPVAIDHAALQSALERFRFLIRKRDHGGVRDVLADLDIGYITKGRSVSERREPEHV